MAKSKPPKEPPANRPPRPSDYLPLSFVSEALKPTLGQRVVSIGVHPAWEWHKQEAQ